MKTNNDNLNSVSALKDKYLGAPGTPSREEYEQEFQEFKVGVLLQEARLKKGMTQEQLAAKCGTTKSYISKIENNLKEVRISTLRRIVQEGLGGKLVLGVEV